MTSAYVKPREGGRVRMPERNSKVMPPEGATVPLNSYYERLLTEGDVVRADAPKRARAEPQKSQKNSPKPDAASGEVK